MHNQSELTKVNLLDFAIHEKRGNEDSIEIQEEYVNTEFGKSYVIKGGNTNNPPLVLLHAASCGSPIWYKNFEELSKSYSLYAIDCSPCQKK